MIRVRRSAVIDAPIDRVWAVLRDFNSHSAWHPAVGDSRIERNEARRPGRLRAQLLPQGRQPHPRAAARALRPRLHLHLLHPRRHAADAELRRHGSAEEGDRRRPHLLALGIDLRRAEGPRARVRAARRRRRVRGRLRRPAQLLEWRQVCRPRGGRGVARRGRDGIRRTRGAAVPKTGFAATQEWRSAHPPDRGRRELHRRLHPQGPLPHDRAAGADRHGGGGRGGGEQRAGFPARAIASPMPARRRART